MARRVDSLPGNVLLVPLESKAGLHSSGSIWRRVLSSHEVIRCRIEKNKDNNKYEYKMVFDSIGDYTKIVPCNPLLSFFNLLRYDKNRDNFDWTYQIKFESQEAEYVFEKYIAEIYKPGLCSIEFSSECMKGAVTDGEDKG